MPIYHEIELFSKELIKHNILEYANKLGVFLGHQDISLKDRVKMAVVQTFDELIQKYDRIFNLIGMLFILYFILGIFLKSGLFFPMYPIINELLFNIIAIVLAVLIGLQIRDYIKLRKEIANFGYILLDIKNMFIFGIILNRRAISKYIYPKYNKKLGKGKVFSWNWDLPMYDKMFMAEEKIPKNEKVTN